MNTTTQGIIETGLQHYKDTMNTLNHNIEKDIIQYRKEINKVWKMCEEDYDEDIFDAFIKYCFKYDYIPDITIQLFNEAFVGEFKSIENFIDDYLDQECIELHPMLILDYNSMWKDKFSHDFHFEDGFIFRHSGLYFKIKNLI